MCNNFICKKKKWNYQFVFWAFFFFFQKRWLLFSLWGGKQCDLPQKLYVHGFFLRKNLLEKRFRILDLYFFLQKKKIRKSCLACLEFCMTSFFMLWKMKFYHSSFRNTGTFLSSKWTKYDFTKYEKIMLLHIGILVFWSVV